MARQNLKHVGQLVNTGKRCVVVFRELPDEPDQCLVVDTEAVPDWMHDDIINAVEAPGAQSSPNFYEYAERSVFTDGTNMLQTLHSTGRLMKTPTDNVKMTPNNSDSLGLSELNNIVRETDGDKPIVSPPADEVPMASKADTPASTSKNTEGLDDTALAKDLLAQAKTFETEAKNLKAQAYDLAPGLKPGPKKPAAKATPRSETVTSFTSVSS